MTNCNGYEMVKPCPLCGAVAYCQFDSKTDTWQIRCGCGYETPKMQTQKEVCELWNGNNNIHVIDRHDTMMLIPREKEGGIYFENVLEL